MTPEETLQKAIEIASGKFLGRNYETILFSRSFWEALVGKEFVYPKARAFSTTGYVRGGPRSRDPEVEVSIADYHLMMIAKSDDRIGYLEQVLLDLERK